MRPHIPASILPETASEDANAAYSKRGGSTITTYWPTASNLETTIDAAIKGLKTHFQFRNDLTKPAEFAPRKWWAKYHQVENGGKPRLEKNEF